jgi:hypothetical protein
VIILSGVLVVLAFALLLAGVLFGNSGTEVVGLDGLTLLYVSIAISIVSALCLALGVFLRRREIFGRPGSTQARTAKGAKKRGKVTGAEAAGAPSAGGDPGAEDTLTIPGPRVDVPGDAVVYVVRGRKRYHLDNCRQLMGRDKEELTYAEAQEEGFSPCTACMPDTALAARAAVSGEHRTYTPAEKAGAAAGRGRFGHSAKGGRGAELAPGTRTDEYERPQGLREVEDPWRSREEPVKTADTAATARFGTIAPEDEDDSRSWAEPRSPHDPGAEDESRAQDASRRVEEHGPEAETRTEEEAYTEDPAGAEDEMRAEADAHTRDDARTRDDSPAEDAGWNAGDPSDGSETEVRRRQEVEPADGASGHTVDDHDGGTPLATAPDPDAWVPGEDGPGDQFEDESDEDRTQERPSREAPESDEEPGEEPDDDRTQVRILSGTKRYHRSGCALIEDIGDEAEDLETLTRSEAAARGCTPCLVCRPDSEDARA